MEETHAQQSAIDRVRRMEDCFDRLCAAAAHTPASIGEDASLWDMWQSLLRYYEGSAWLEDYERDERGGFPADLKRGVLSEDGVYNLLCELENGFAQTGVMKRPHACYTGLYGESGRGGRA